MKKYLLIVLCFLILTGCNKKESSIEEDDLNINDTNEEIIVDTYVDDNPIKVGLYMDGKLLNEYNTTLVDGTDIAVFDVYFTNEENVDSTNTKYNFKKYYSMYEDIDNYKIGFFVSFDTVDNHYELTIKNPDAERVLAPYIFVYLYDDVHQADYSWYSHVTMDEFNDETILSSIKLCMVSGASDIITPITLEVFTYDSDDDFDSEGHYRGVSSYTIKINNK